MEPQQTTNQDSNEAMVNMQSTGVRGMDTLLPQQADQPCPTCGSQTKQNNRGDFAPSFVYAIGRIQPRFSALGVEKEFAQAAASEGPEGLTDRQVIVDVLKKHRYLARRLCYVLTIAGMETYILQPRDPMDLDLLIEAIRPKPSPMDMDIVIGVRGPIAPPEMCNGLMVPIVVVNQLYSFDRDSLLNAIPRSRKASKDSEGKFEASSSELLERIMQMTDNAGSSDEHRALNYLAVRYPEIYVRTAERHSQGASLTALEVHSSALSNTRKIVEVIFSYTDRRTDVIDKVFVRVDVTEDFPFLVTKLSPYYDR